MSSKETGTAVRQHEIGSPLDIDQDYIREKIAEAHRLRAEALARMVRSLFARRPAAAPAPRIGAARRA